MKTDSIKPNPFLEEVEKLLTGLGLDVSQAKHVVPNGVLFYFNFNDLPIYFSVPNVLPCPYSNIARIEAEVADLPEVEAAQLTVSIASYLQIEDCTPVRVATKRSKADQTKVLIEFVCDLQLLHVGSLAHILLHCCELADHLRNEMLVTDRPAAA